MRSRLWIVLAGSSIFLSSCGSSPTSPDGSGTELVRETLTAAISAVTSPACSGTFQTSVEPSYYFGGSQRCVEFPRSSTTAGIITARLTWEDRRIDLDLMLNNGAGSNFRQSIAANRCCETVEFFVNPRTTYIFVVYLRGVDAQFLANGGTFAGDISTPFTLTIERPK